jgi:L,D-transpeptidase ErfK/SrfK
MEPSPNSAASSAGAPRNTRTDRTPAAPPAPPRRSGGPGWFTGMRVVWLLAGVAVLLVLGVVFAGTGYRYDTFTPAPPGLAPNGPKDERAVKQAVAKLRTRETALRARLKAAAPRGVYVVIDQTHNRLYLKKDEETLLEAVCSAGSGMVLKETGGKKREWVFDTPRGQFEVLSRSENPVWKKPDWAFVEEGEAIPKNPAERLDYGSLGEYALYFGNGFMIHGTLYERLLGRAVSHGCIRVGRDDLRKVWSNTRIGTHIYIY